MLDWLPQRQPQQAIAVFGIVLSLSLWVIVPLAISDGSDGLGSEIRRIQRQAGVPGGTPGLPPGFPPTSTTPPPSTPPTTPVPPPTTPPPTTPPPPPPTAEPTPRPPAERSVGETATDDGLRLTVDSIREVSRIEREAYYKTPLRPPRGGILIAAEVTYVNETKAPIDPFCGGNSAALVDGKGRTHETLEALYSIEGNDSVCGGADTRPGETATVTLAFKLRRGVRFSHLELWNGKYVPDFDGEASRVRFR